jgi:hypothetical protein
MCEIRDYNTLNPESHEVKLRVKSVVVPYFAQIVF